MERARSWRYQIAEKQCDGKNASIDAKGASAETVRQPSDHC